MPVIVLFLFSGCGGDDEPTGPAEPNEPGTVVIDAEPNPLGGQGLLLSGRISQEGRIQACTEIFNGRR